MSHTVHVAFVYPITMCPPEQRDPRKFGAGECIGVFVDWRAARGAIEQASHPRRENYSAAWRRYKDAQDPDCWFLSVQNNLHSVHFGYVETTTLERRVTADRRRS